MYQDNRTWKERLSPFLVLLEARYLPLLLLAAPQAYTVGKWLYASGERNDLDLIFAVIGALSFEFSYVGSIAWAEGHAKSRWVWLTAVTALVFSVAVAVYLYYGRENVAAILHSGFPLVAFAYTMTIHSVKPAGGVQSEETKSLKAELAEFMSGMGQHLTKELEMLGQEINTLNARIAVLETEQALTREAVRESVQQLPQITLTQLERSQSVSLPADKVQEALELAHKYRTGRSGWSKAEFEQVFTQALTGEVR